MRTFRNSVCNVVGLGVSATLGLFYTPYLVTHLGATAYGLAPLVMSLFVFATWLSMSINWSVGRFVTIAQTRGEHADVTKIFSTAVLTSLAMIGLLMVATAGITPFLGRILRLPIGSENAARVLVWCGSIATGCSILSGVFEVGFFALNRLDYRAFLMVVRSAGAAGMVIALFHWHGARLEWIGVGTATASVMTCIAAFLWCRRLIPALRIDLDQYSLAWLKRMAGTNIWIVVDQLGTIFMINLSLFLANRLYGAESSAEYALAQQWDALLRSLMAALSVFTPVYYRLVAQGDTEGLRKTSRRASRFVAYSMALAGGGLIGCAPYLVGIWLGYGAENVALLATGLAATIVVNAAANPLSGVWHALNRVRTPSLATIGAGVVSMILTVVLAKTTALGPWAVVIGCGVPYTARNLFFSVLYVARLLGMDGGPYFAVLIRSVVAAACVGVGVGCATRWIDPENWLELVEGCALGTLMALIPFIFVIWDRGLERDLAEAALRLGLPDRWMARLGVTPEQSQEEDCRG